jgi:serine/threonine protein kinase/tetratricopeptide (TPR) repeat protein
MRLCHQCGAQVDGTDRFCATCGAAVQAESGPKRDPLVGRTVGGSYVLQELIGVGGMGRVYRAEQSTLGRTVAVKVIHPHLLGDEATVARFYTEARAASSLNHPNSVSIIDFGRSDDGVLYLVMEFLQGKDLAQVMHDEGPLPIVRVCEVLIGVLGALGEAHALGVVHRDLKPENIILKRFRSGADLVKVVDFGLATIVGAVGSSITAPGLVCGTPDYMSPEQGQGDDMDGRGDLYSLGVVLYELLTETLPFEDETPTKVVLRHINDPVPSPKRTAPQRGISDELDAIAVRALQKKPADRFQNAEEMQRALERVVEEERRRSSKRVPCPSCGAPNPDNMRFCGSCGARISTSLGVVSTGRSPSVRPSIYPTAPESERPIIGRQRELELLDALRADGLGHAKWIHVCGEPGVGKTRLINEAAARGRARQEIVAVASAHPLRAPVPYWAIRGALSGLLDMDLTDLSALDRMELVPDALARAGFAEAGQPSGLEGVDGVGRAPAVAAAVAFAVESARVRHRSESVLLVFDDFQRMDGLSQAVVRELVELFAQKPGLRVLTAGDREQAGASNVVLQGLETEDAKLFLAQCSVASGAASPATLPASKDRHLLPLYLEQVHALGEEGEVVPPRLADAVASRVERIGAQARKFLQAASVLGERSSLRDVTRIVGAGDAAGLDRLIHHQLVRVEGDQLAIVHPFLAELVEASIPAAARRALHERALKVATEEHGGLEVRAEHAYRAGEPLTALVFLERMGDAAMQRGDASAAVLAFRRALELGRREMLETGDLMLEQAMVTFSRKLGEALEKQGEFGGADGVLREALDLAGPRSPERARMLVALGRVAMHRDRRRDAARSFGLALETATLIKDELLEATVFAAMARAREAEGDLKGAADAMRRAVDLRTKAEDQPHRRATALTDLGEMLIGLRDHAEAIIRLSEADSLAEQCRALALRARATGLMGQVDELSGRRARAVERYRDAARLAAEAGDAPSHTVWRKRAGTVDPQ